MQKKWAIGGILVLLIGILALWFTTRSIAPEYAFTLAAGDEITDWEFAGAYTGSADLEAKARAEIDRLEKLLGTGEYSDYTLYISIANQHDLLGDGERELEYLEKAIALNATTSGLAWYNAGVLFERLGALVTARIAYERAVAVQPIAQYRAALIDFLERQYPNDTEAIRAAEQGAGAMELPQ